MRRNELYHTASAVPVLSINSVDVEDLLLYR